MTITELAIEYFRKESGHLRALAQVKREGLNRPRIHESTKRAYEQGALRCDQTAHFYALALDALIQSKQVREIAFDATEDAHRLAVLNFELETALKEMLQTFDRDSCDVMRTVDPVNAIACAKHALALVGNATDSRNSRAVTTMSDVAP